jgi:hypothetical protein
VLPVTHWRKQLPVLGVLALVYPVPFAVAQLAPDSAAHLVPADVGIFVEVRNAEDLLTKLIEPQLWTGLAAIAGQPADPAETRKWREIIQRSVAMEPEEAIRVLFADGVAFVGRGIGRSQDAVVIARPPARMPPATLLHKWGAKPINGDAEPSAHWLYRNLGVAAHERALIFGDLLPPQGMFRHVLDQLRETDSPKLAGDAVFQKLLAFVPANPDGLCFLRLDPEPSSQPTSRPRDRFPGPLGDSRHAMLAMHRDGAMLHFTAIGDAVGAPPGDAAAASRVDVRRLPRESLLVWASGVDFDRLVSQLDALPPAHPLRLVMDLLPSDASAAQLASYLHSHAALVVGVVTVSTSDVPPLPAIGLVVELRDAAAASSCVDRMIATAVVVYDSLSLVRGRPALDRPVSFSLGAAEASVLDLTDTVAGFGESGLGELQLAWAIHDGTLIVASHVNWLRKIVASRSGAAPALSDLTGASSQPFSPRDDNAIIVQLGAIADAGQRWLDYLQSTDSPLLLEPWWRDRQAVRGTQLGIDVAQDRRGKRLTVRRVKANTPADGVLRGGDAIVGCSDRRFATPEPIKEIRRAIRERPDPAWIALLIERDSVIREVRVPLPYLNPIRAMERLIALGRVAQSVVYHDATGEEGLRGYLTVQLRVATGEATEVSADQKE